MTVPRQVAERAKRSEELQRRLSGENPDNPEAKSQEQEQATENAPVKPTRVEPAPSADDDDTPVIGPDAAGQLHDWKRRFGELTQVQQATKAELNRLQQMAQQREAEQAERIAQLEERLNAAAKAQPVDRSFLTEDDLAIVGEDNLAVVEKVIERRVERAVAELENKRKAEQDAERKKIEQQRAIMQRQEHFKTRLKALVDDFSRIDDDPKFIAWMQKPDKLTGEPRLNLLQRSFAADDVGRAASFYFEYAAQSGGGSNDKRDQMVEPAPAAPAQPRQKSQGKIWTRGEIKEYYSLKTRGVFDKDPQRAAAIERDIAEAHREGRITR